MRQVEGLPVETLAVPGNGETLQATRLSDHSPFWDAGFSALMITDTSFMRNPHYHQPSDTPETLDPRTDLRVNHNFLKNMIETLKKRSLAPDNTAENTHIEFVHARCRLCLPGRLNLDQRLTETGVIRTLSAVSRVRRP